MIEVPDPIIEEHDGFRVVNDSHLPGGSKYRALVKLLKPGRHYVYASSAEGFAQVALAMAARDVDAQATIFTAKRSDATTHANTKAARAAGANIERIPNGYLKTHVQPAAQRFAIANGAELLPYGLDYPEFIEAQAETARGLFKTPPKTVWCAGGSGVLTRSLQLAWPLPNTFHYAVIVGKQAEDYGDACTRHQAPEKFGQKAKIRPPFESCVNYDAKVWQFMKKYAKPGDVFWNVAGNLQATISPELADLATSIKENHRHFVSAAQRSWQYAKTTGDLLLQIKDLLKDKPDSRFMPWVEEHCQIAHRTANDYMQLAKRWEDPAFAKERAENPTLTIHAALHFLRGKNAGKNMDKKRHDLGPTVRKLTQRLHADVSTLEEADMKLLVARWSDAWNAMMDQLHAWKLAGARESKEAA